MSDKPHCLVDGRPVEVAAGYQRAAEILNGACRPLVFGLGGATCETVRLASAIADRLNACIDVADSAQAALTSAAQSAGLVTATLGEVRHRADLVIFWRVDPATTHPRHFERYSLACCGRFVPRGRPDRTCVVVDDQPTATAAEADLFLPIRPGRDEAALSTLQLLVNNADVDAERMEKETGVALARWRELFDMAKAARYGALFFDPHTISMNHEAGAIEGLLVLVRGLNESTPFVAMPMGTAGNAVGAEQVLTWQTGHPYAVSFEEGRAKHDAAQYSTAAMLSSGRSDAALVVNAHTIPALPKPAHEHLATIPAVVMSADEGAPSTAAVVFRVAVPGIHTGGTVFRSDGVPLALRPTLVSSYPTSEEVLTQIHQRLTTPATHTDQTR